MTERSTTSWVDRLTQEPWVYRTGVAVRLAAVVVGILVSAAQGVLADSWNLALLLGALALIVGLKGIRWGGSAPWWAVLELTVAGVFLGIEAPFNPYFLGYLLAAGATAGVVYGIAIGLSGLVASGFGLTLMAWLVGAGLAGSEVVVVGQWYLIAALGVLAAGWSRVLIRRRRRVDDRYQAAYQLLVRLREVTRSLPTALDDVTAATTMLDLIGRSVPFDHAAVLRIDDHGPPQPLTVAGGDTIPWYPDSESWLMRRVDETGAAAQSMVWLAQGSTTDPSAHRTFRAIVPVDVGRTRIGLVTLQRNTPWTDEQLAEASDIVERSALMLDTAFVFGDVRSMATTEERRRLAREIHDGVAQEIAGLAYVVDDVAHREKDPQLQQDLSSIREDLTRLVSELRLSIFELRSGIDPGLGLGSSLSTYVRQIGTRGGITVHLVLEEDATRLPADIEVEIMRIVQEAITNARRHSRAKNLWVTLRTSPPRALVRVADDGVGLRGKRGDSYGLEIMRERAARIGGRLDVRQRVGGGTVVDLSVGDFTAPAATIAEPGIDDTLHMQRGATA
ncbi:MAG: sensor histidine kinase [Actinobacteria bacterium]|nr:sensor histidine kinase [Actinomycetota bacterium]MCB9412257.1 sensor histidine kinase [Actinomycetota bacterium]